MPGEPPGPASPDGAIEVFVFHRGQFLGSRMFSASRVVTIGASPDSAIRLEAPEIAQRHAVLYVDGGRLCIADNGGTSGVLVNGQTITTAAVSGFDDIRIGDFRLKVEIMTGSAVFKPPAPPPAGVPSRVARDPGSTDVPFAPARADTVPSMRQQNKAPDETSLVPRRGRISEPPPPPRETSSSARGRQNVPSFPERIAPLPAAPRAPIKPAAPAPMPSGRPSAIPLPPSRSAPKRDDSRELVNDLLSNPGVDHSSEGMPTMRVEPHAIESVAVIDPPDVSSKPLPPEPTVPQKPIDATMPARPMARPAAQPSFAGVLGEPDAAPVHESPHHADDPSQAGLPDTLREYLEEGDDEEDEDLNFEAPFSLLDNVVRERFRTPIKAEPVPAVEVIRYREGRLISVDRVSRGENFRFFDARSGSPFELLRYKRNGRARLFFNEGLRGNVVIGGHTTPLQQLLDDQHRADKKGKLFVVEITEGDFAHVKLEGEGYLVRYVRPPMPPPVSYGVAFSREDKLYATSALLGILLMLAVIWIQAIVSPPELFAMEEEVEFAEVTLKDLDLEKPVEEPPPPLPPAEEPPPPEPVAEEAPPPEPVKEPPPKKQRRSKKSDAPADPGPPAKSAAQQDAEAAMAALDNMVPAADTKLSSKVSNIAAVRVPSGTTKRFQLSGPIGKNPGNEVVIGSSSGGRETRSATRLLQEKNVAQLSGGGSGKVRGQVDRIPARRIGTSGGFLSRDEILKVVNAGLADVARCYERELMNNQDLGGKIEFQWVIAASGSVESTRVRSSTLKSEAVASCVSRVIKSWQFPKPQGGSVQVIYPFAFRSQAF